MRHWLQDRVGIYLELQGMRWRDIARRYTNTKVVNIECGTPPLSEARTIDLCSEMLTDYPILYCWDVIVSEAVFRVIDPVLDRDYFLVREYAL